MFAICLCSINWSSTYTDKQKESAKYAWKHPILISIFSLKKNKKKKKKKARKKYIQKSATTKSRDTHTLKRSAVKWWLYSWRKGKTVEMSIRLRERHRKYQSELYKDRHIKTKRKEGRGWGQAVMHLRWGLHQRSENRSAMKRWEAEGEGWSKFDKVDWQ